MKAGAYNASGVMALLIYPRCAGSANAGTMMRRSPRAQRPPPAIYWLRNYGPAALISALRRFSTWIMAALAKHLCHGLALAGMANCGKHFPGHGFVEADSHHAMPVDARALDTLLHDAQPYVWVDLALVAVMPAHVVYSAVDAWPAGFSKIWLRDILRRRLGFSGAILSDDLSMEGARAMGDIVESAQAVLDAGCDMALVCNCPDQTQQVLDRVRHAPSSDSSARLRSLAARGAALSWDALTRQPRYQAARALLNRL